MNNDSPRRLVGYASQWPGEQDADTQVAALVRHGVPEADIFTETVPATANERPQLDLAFKQLARRDILVVFKLDRICRDHREMIDLARTFGLQGIGIRSLSDGVDTTAPPGPLFIHFCRVLGQLEQDLARHRIDEGLARAKAAGRLRGRPSVFTPEKWQRAIRLLAERKNLTEVAQEIGVARSTVSNHELALRAEAPFPFDIWIDDDGNTARHPS